MRGKTFILILGIVLLIGGCAGVGVRTNQRFASYFQGQEKTVTLMPIEIKFYKLTAGGVQEQMDEWDIQSDMLFESAIMEKIDPSPKVKINKLGENSISPDFKEFLDEENGLYRAIAASVISHTYLEGSIFPNKLKSFDYTLGPDLARFNDFVPTDALLFISGTRTYWTGGRMFLAACGILAGAATGVTIIPGGVPDWVSVSLVDAKTGDIIWFKHMGPPYFTVGDLRNAEVVASTVDYLFKDLK
ncbi:MAG: hypothetical protein V1650_04245 [Candidatus Omnitrophota bacterium]